MSQQVFVEEFETAQHSEEHRVLLELALMLHRANVSLILTASSEGDVEQKLLVRVVSTHLLSGINTLVSVLSLTDKLSLKVKEAIALSRVFYENCLVASFTSIGGPERARRAELYSVYRTFRNQTQAHNAGGLKVRVARKDRLSRKDPQVAAALAMFGGSSGIRPCFGESRSDMLKALKEHDPKAGLLFGSVEAMIHDVSSEIIHGSFHGYALFDSLHNSQPETRENLSAHHEMVFFSITLSIAAFARILGAVFATGVDTEKIESACMRAFQPYVPEEMMEELGPLFE